MLVSDCDTKGGDSGGIYYYSSEGKPRERVAVAIHVSGLDPDRVGQSGKFDPYSYANGAVEIAPYYDDIDEVAKHAAEKYNFRVKHLKKAQELLAKLGFDVGPSDGVAGPTTRKAIRTFQKLKGLTITGEVSPETFAAIEKAAK